MRSSAAQYDRPMPHVVTLSNDGIGPEIVAPTVTLLTRLVSDLTVEENVFCGASNDAYGTAMTDEALLGAVGGPRGTRPTPVRRAESTATLGVALHHQRPSLPR